MTAQIVILNKHCAGVASDTSVTMVGPDGPIRAYQQAEKVLALPAPHSIVTLHSGRTEILGVPYEVALGEWIRTLPTQPLPNVSDYQESFCTWLGEQRGLFAHEQEQGHFGEVVNDLFHSIRHDILEQCTEQELTSEHFHTPRAQEIVTDVLNKFHAYADAYDPLPGWEDVDATAVTLDFMETVSELREYWFDDTPRTDEGDAAMLHLIPKILAGYRYAEQGATIAFAGFGGREVFPVCQTVDLFGIVGQHLRHGNVSTWEISASVGSQLIPLGQKEAIDTFLTGYNGIFVDRVSERVGQFASEVKTLVNAGTALSTQIDRLSDEAKTAVSDDFVAASHEAFTGPLLRTICALPPAQVADLARSLVGLAVLRQLTQAQVETVGGPIEVALVTRREGVRELPVRGAV